VFLHFITIGTTRLMLGLGAGGRGGRGICEWIFCPCFPHCCPIWTKLCLQFLLLMLLCLLRSVKLGYRRPYYSYLH